MGLITRAADRLLRQGPGDQAAPPEGVVTRLQEQFGADSPKDYGSYIATSDTVYACVKMRSDAFAKVPLVVTQEMRDGEQADVAPDHPLKLLLGIGSPSRVNPWWTRGHLFRATQMSLSLHGAAFWGLASPAQGAPTQLWWLHPERMRVVPSRDEYIQGFLYRTGDGKDVAFTPEDVYWQRYHNPNDEFTGLSPVASIRLHADYRWGVMRYNNALVKNDARPAGVITRRDAKGFNRDQAQELRDRWNEAMKGPDNRGKIGVLWGDTQYQNIGMPPQDLQFIEGQRVALEAVARAYQVPPPLIADLERATYDNVDAMVRFFHSSWLVDELTWTAEELTAHIAPRFGENLRVSFDTNALEALREDQAKQAERDRIYIGAGVLTINEIRRRDGLDDVPWGDAWWGPLTSVPITGAGGFITPDETQAEMAALKADTRISALGRELGVAFKLLNALLVNRFAGQYDAFFKGQADRVMERLERVEELTADALMPPAEDAELLNATKPMVGAIIGQVTDLINSVLPRTGGGLVLPVHANGDGGGTALAVKTRQPVGLDDPTVLKLFTEAAERVVQINDVTKDFIRQQLAIARDLGLDRFTIANGNDEFTGLNDIVTQLYRNRGVTIARTETAWASNLTAADRYEQRGITQVEVLDGTGTVDDPTPCGWKRHDDTDVAHGSRRTIAQARDYPIAHPNCVRVMTPVLD